MGALSRRTSRAARSGVSIAAAACVFAAAVAGACGFAAGFLVRGEWLGLQPKISAASSIDQRFPAEWSESTAPPRSAYASAEATFSLFDPNPVYPARSGEVASSTAAASAAEPPSAEITQSVSAPARLASAAPVRAVRRPNAVLNESQIASIKRRLNLTADQERYWPAVEAELRKMEYQKDPKAHGTRSASIDMTKVNVEGLKSAGLPLVMSFNEDQKQELRSLAHLLGLENAISTF